MISRTQEEITQNWPKEWDTPIVSIRCAAFNHEKYIVNALDGFLKQETNFPFEVIVHDDASTDKTVSIIKEYEKKYPNIIKPIYETENQYSKHDGSLRDIITAACKGKYFALCEGDDYWTDPNKLQMQIDWLENHPDYTMCCSDATIISPNGILDWHRYANDCDIPVKDMILGGGSFVQTATLVYRKRLLEDYPELCKKCHVGDYPLQIWSVLNGKVRYFAKKTAAYNYRRPNSWTSNQTTTSVESLLKGARSEFEMLDFLNTYSNGNYSEIFLERKTKILYNLTRTRPKQKNFILKQFHDYEKNFNRLQKLEGILIRLNLWFLIDPYLLLLQKKYKDALYSLPILRVLVPFIYYNLLGHKKN